MIAPLKISDEEFHALRDLMYAVSGVKLLPTKKPLVVARLRKRLKELHIDSFKEYLGILQKPHSKELEIFVNAITTNETFFYRHPEQFHFLVSQVLPSLLPRGKLVELPELRIWSAGCSTGEEPYSIAIACREFFKNHPKWRVTIYASDINSTVLDSCQRATYNARSVIGISAYLRKTYFDELVPAMVHQKKEYQLREDVVNSVRFLHHNLLKSFLFDHLDIIFIRNVMIYFDRASKQKVVELLEKNLVPGGYLFTSLAESLQDIKSGLRYVQAGVYRKQ